MLQFIKIRKKKFFLLSRSAHPKTLKKSDKKFDLGSLLKRIHRDGGIVRFVEQHVPYKNIWMRSNGECANTFFFSPTFCRFSAFSPVFWINKYASKLISVFIFLLLVTSWSRIDRKKIIFHHLGYFSTYAIFLAKMAFFNLRRFQ